MDDLLSKTRFEVFRVAYEEDERRAKRKRKTKTRKKKKRTRESYRATRGR